MKLRIEFTDPGRGAAGLKWVLRLCRQQPSFKESVEDGMPIYSLEFDGNAVPTFLGIYERIQGWKNVAVFVDGKLVDKNSVWQRISEFTREKRMHFNQIKNLLDGISEAYD